VEAQDEALDRDVGDVGEAGGEPGAAGSGDSAEQVEVDLAAEGDDEIWKGSPGLLTRYTPPRNASRNKGVTATAVPIRAASQRAAANSSGEQASSITGSWALKPSGSVTLTLLIPASPGRCVSTAVSGIDENALVCPLEPAKKRSRGLKGSFEQSPTWKRDPTPTTRPATDSSTPRTRFTPHPVGCTMNPGRSMATRTLRTASSTSARNAS
jgi:hypothetical protein